MAESEPLVPTLCTVAVLAAVGLSACTTTSHLAGTSGDSNPQAAGQGSADSQDSPDSAPGDAPSGAEPPVAGEGEGQPEGQALAAASPGGAGSENPGSPTSLPPLLSAEDAPAQERPAQERPVAASGIAGVPERTSAAGAKPPAPAKPPVQLASVPRTPVESRPTNQIMMVRTTAYSHLEADSLPYGNKSAAGTPLRYGNVRSAAADWSKYPMGTRFQIEGLPHIYEIDDYGSALAGTETIDIYKPNLQGIRDWGARNVPIRVLEWGCYEESRRILDSRKHVRHAHHVRKMLQEIERKGREGKLPPPRSSGTPSTGQGA